LLCAREPCGAAVSVSRCLSRAEVAPIFGQGRFADLKARLEKLLPEAQVIDYRETKSGADAGAGSGDESAVADEPGGRLVLGAIGVCDGRCGAQPAAAAGYDCDYEVAGGRGFGGR